MCWQDIFKLYPYNDTTVQYKNNDLSHYCVAYNNLINASPTKKIIPVFPSICLLVDVFFQNKIIPVFTTAMEVGLIDNEAPKPPLSLSCYWQRHVSVFPFPLNTSVIFGRLKGRQTCNVARPTTNCPYNRFNNLLDEKHNFYYFAQTSNVTYRLTLPPNSNIVPLTIYHYCQNVIINWKWAVFGVV